MGGYFRRAAGGNPGGLFRSGFVAGLLALLAPAAWPDVPPAEPPNPATCRSIPDDQARLHCYDQALDARSGSAVTGSAPPPAAPPNGESLFGKPPEESRRLASRELGLEDPASLEATVAQTSRSAAGKLVIGLRNGQVWTQLDTTPLELEPGDPIRIRKAALGSYLLQKQSGGRRLRVRRTQ